MGKKLELNYDQIIEKIRDKKEFSQIPLEDVKLIYSQFEVRTDLILEEKIKLTRDLLRKMYTAFVSSKLLSVKDKDADWFLRKHISTAERLGNYVDLYKRVLAGLEEDCMVVDFGCGINGFSFEYFSKLGYNVNYLGLEPVGQLVSLQNHYFKKNKLSGAKCVQASLFDLENIKKIIFETKEHRIGFFFKVLDSLEMLKKDYSKKVLVEIVPLFERIVVSWATSSLVSKKKFHAERKWLKGFIEKEFFIVEEFDLGNEHYLVFRNNK